MTSRHMIQLMPNLLGGSVYPCCLMSPSPARDHHKAVPQIPLSLLNESKELSNPVTSLSDSGRHSSHRRVPAPIFVAPHIKSSEFFIGRY